MSASAPAPRTESSVLETLPTLEVEHDAAARRALLTVGETWAYLAALAGLVVLNVPTLGADPWRFRPGPIEPHGSLAPLVEMARSRWDPALLRSAALVAALVIAVYAAFISRAAARRLVPLLALTATVLALLVLPAVLLQAGLRDATAPWFFTNDSTYQIELAGDLVASGQNPYGHNYASSGLERFYSLEGTDGRVHVATEHFAYFPGTAVAASVWNALPSPWDDFRLLVALATVATFFAVLLFRAPLLWRLALGAVLAANPLAIRAAWFGNADAAGILLLVLAFALVSRSRYVGAAALLAAAILFKQFALVAVPFLAVALFMRAGRRVAWKATGAFAAVLGAGLAPFVIADLSAFWTDTITYGVQTYNIVGYGLASLLVRADLIAGRTDAYPFFWLALFVWLPATIFLVRAQLRSRELWMGAAGFALSIFLLIFIGRVFHASYLLWPLAGIAVASLLAASMRFPLVGMQGAPPTSTEWRLPALQARRRSTRREAGDRLGR